MELPSGAIPGTVGVAIIVVDPNLFAGPSNLTGKVSGHRVTLTWNDDSGNETGFYIERGTKTKGG